MSVALVGPYFIDWTSYRADFEREASTMLGREVKVNGEAQARLLPFPSVSFSDVTVAGATPGEPAMRAERFSMDLELAPFIRGEVLIFDMRLERPEVVVALTDDGRFDWSLRPETYFSANRVSLEKLTVVEGRLRLRHGSSGREHLISEINTDISARALSGPWRVEGSMRFDGMKSAVSLSTGTAGEDGRMRMRLRVQPERYPLVVESDGAVSTVEGSLRYAGPFSLNIGIAQTEPAQPAYRVRGDFALDHQRLDIGEFRFETGPADDPYMANGTAFLDFSRDARFSVTADGAQVRIDDTSSTAEGGIALGERLAAVAEFLRDLPQPTIQGTLELNLPAVVAGDTTVRDIRLKAEPVDGAWALEGMHASLPGRTTLEGRGVLSVAEALSFKGSLLLAVAQPSGFASWVSSDVNDAIRRLPAAGFSATVDLSETAQRFSDLELILGNARFRGGIERSSPVGARPSILLELDGERLDVEGMLAFASLFVGTDGARRLAGEDVDLELKAGPVSAFGMVAERMDTALRLREEGIEIDRLMIGGLEGASISATGTLGLSGDVPTGNLDADLLAVDLQPLVTVLARQFPQYAMLREFAARTGSYPGLLSDTRLSMVLSSAGNGNGSTGLAITGQGTTEQTQFSLTASGAAIEAGADDTLLELKAEVRAEDAGALYALYGLPALPMGLAGSASTEIGFTGSTASGGDMKLAIEGEGLKAGFDGVLSVDTDRLALSGEATIASDDLEPWLMTAAVSFPGAGLGLPLSLSANIDRSDDLTVISNLRGEIADTRIAGDLNMDFVDGLPHFTGELDLASLDLRPFAEMVLGSGVLQAADDGWPQAVFAPGPNLSAGLDLSVSVDRLTLAEGWVADAARGRFRLDGSGLHLTDMQAAFGGGRVAGLVELSNNDGSGLLAAQIRLENGDLTALLPEMGLEGQADIGASATASGKSVSAMVASLAGSGTLAFKDVSIEGINPDPFDAIIIQADAIGRDIDAAAVAGFAPDLLRAGRFPIGSGEAAFALASGVVRVPPVRIETETASLSTEIRIDLGARQVSADANVAYAPGREELVGSSPSVRFSATGPFSEPQVSIDTAPLAQFLTQRALEIEQRRVEAMQAALLEGQRLRREVRYYAALEEARIAEQERLRLEQEEERRRLEQELRLLRQEQERSRLEAEQRRQAEEEARRRAAEEAARLRGQEAQRQAPAPLNLGTIERAPLPGDRPDMPIGPPPPPGNPASIFSPENLRLQ